jgi:regulator of protease activity HflC (stomatin/prohibitin superfamily)
VRPFLRDVKYPGGVREPEYRAENTRLDAEAEQLRAVTREASREAIADARQEGAVQALHAAVEHLTDTKRKAEARAKTLGKNACNDVGAYRSAAGRAAGLADALTVLTDHADRIDAGEDPS